MISERDPGVANWLELTERRRGYVQIRWQRLTQGPHAAGRSAGIGGPRFAEVPARLPYYQDARVPPPQWRARIAAGQAAVAMRMLG